MTNQTEATYDEVIEEIVKHLPGKHNQEAHGGPDTGGKESVQGPRGGINYLKVKEQIKAGAAKAGKSIEEFAAQKLNESEVVIKRELGNFKKSDDWGAIKMLGKGTKAVAQAAGRAYVGAVKRNIKITGKIAIKAALSTAIKMNPALGVALGVYKVAQLLYRGKKAVEGAAAGLNTAGEKFNEADQKVHAWSNEQRAKLFGKKSTTDENDMVSSFQEIISQLDVAKQSPDVDAEDKANLDKIRSIFSALQEQAR